MKLINNKQILVFANATAGSGKSSKKYIIISFRVKLTQFNLYKGKTFKKNKIGRALLAGKKVKAAAYTGIAATLISSATTFYKQFKAPLDPSASGYLNISKNTKFANDLLLCNLIVIDECTQLNKHFIKKIM